MFKSKRIGLRKLRIEDHLVYNQWQNDSEVMKNTSLQLDQHSIADTHAFIEMILSQHNAKGFIIESLDTEKAIGIVSLINIDNKNSNAELIIDIGDKSMWNQGIGTEVLELFLHYVFMELNLHRISLQVFSFNERAIGLYEKLGFTVEGRIRESLYREGDYHDTIQMGILKSEYKKNDSLGYRFA